MKRAFTLPELLVAVAVLAVLLALLLPALAGSKQAARAARCGANQRSIAGLVNAYVLEHDHLPPAWPVIDDQPGSLRWLRPDAGVWTCTRDQWTYLWLPAQRQAAMAGRPMRLSVLDHGRVELTRDTWNWHGPRLVAALDGSVGRLP